MLPKTQPENCVYFGCLEDEGHFAHGFRERKDIRDWLNKMDGMMHCETSNRWLVHLLFAADGTPMTFLTKRDRSVDSRGMSWAGFLMPGHKTFADAHQTAKENWPDLKIWTHKE